ncbi:hypothetical protein O181_002667 [Austropuccinia psidii MF-1]|uniref:Uncharacterized protein n=1 Tax=Austropuccinia psidii MF-1 TaxID=1389203 RepID=A0A9Q3BCX2_9BASI|nr:hypothetical protein [Austropuccinia psidii MF-1]
MQRNIIRRSGTDVKEGDQVLVSTLNFNNLKRPKKTRDSFVGLLTIIELICKNVVEVKLKEEFSRKHPVFPEETPPQQRLEVEDYPGPLKKIMKARNIILNGKDKRQYLVRCKNQTADKDKWLAEHSMPDRNLHLRGLKAYRRTEKSHQQ